MKKTLVLLTLICAGIAAGAETPTTTYWGGDNGFDLLYIGSDNPNAFYCLSSTDGGSRLNKAQLPYLTTEGEETYDLLFKNVADAQFSLSQAVYFKTVKVGTGSPTTYTIDFGTSGSLHTTEEMNFGASTQSIVLKASLSDGEVVSILEQDHVYTRDLLCAMGNHGIWNAGTAESGAGKFNRISLTLSDMGSLNLTQHEGLFVNSIDALAVGEYGLLYTIGTDSHGKTTNILSLAVKTPEPATATLSLLALAALASRRRRH